MADIVTTSFAYGEFAPQVKGRTDLPQYRQATESLQNMLVLPLGSARKRPGTLYLGSVSSETRLLSMQIGPNESIVLELTDGNLRAIDTDGDEVFDIATAPWGANNLWDIRVVQSKYEMVFVSTEFAPQLLEYNVTTPASSTLGALPCSPPTADEFPKFATASAGNRPRTVAYADERLIFGGTDNEPNAIWGSTLKGLFVYLNDATVTSVNFVAPTSGATDSSPYAHIILDSGYIDIQWLRSTSTVQEGVLIAGTTWGVYAIIGLNEAGAISAASIISARQQSSTGCSDAPPVLIGNVMIYVDASKRAIRLLQFNLQGGGFDTPQVNELATHLFDSDVKELHVQRAPNQRIWVLLENGTVLTFSYTTDGSLAAWTPMDFGLPVDSMGIGLGEEEDSVFLIMNDDGTRSIVKMGSFIETDQTKMVFSDRAVMKENGTAFTVVDGLTHLEGEEVVVFADGGMHPPLTVVSGEVELNREVNTAVVGKSYRAEIKTLPIPEAIVDVKRVSRLYARFLDTLGARADTEEFEEIVPFREGNFVMGQIPALFSGIKEIPYQGRHDRDGVVSLYSDSPTPFHILSLITRLEVYR